VFVVGHLGDWRRAAAVLFERESLSGHPAPRREAGQRIAPALAARTRGGGGLGTDFDCDGWLIPSTGDILHCLNAGAMGRIDYETETLIAFDARQSDVIQYGERSGPLDTDGHTIAVALRGREGGGTAELSTILSAMRASQGGGDKPYVLTKMQVRRLMPRECERLQGFPDDYTLIPYRGKPAADGPRYKALGNSMAVPVMRWIGQRIALVERVCSEL
jgi:DNA (cytosine-5)-methyltransferase 1